MRNIKIQHYSLFLVVLMAIFFPDTLLSILHHLVVGLYELIEGVLDEIIEHLFHTDRYTTQLIVFYLMLTAMLFMAYRLIIYIHKQWRQFKSQCPFWCEQCRQRWNQQSLTKKIQYVCGVFLGCWCASYLLM